jgi:hypothetical protein
MADQRIAYFVRHQQSEQNKQGFGFPDTSLSPEGQAGARQQAARWLALEPDLIIAGSLKRHQETLDILLRTAGKDLPFKEDYRLNAFFDSPLLTLPAKETEEAYGLRRFKEGIPTSHGILNAKDAKVFPFDPLYCQAYLDKELRGIVFPGDRTLIPFSEIETRVKGFQEDLKVSGARRVLLISSCSATAYNLEYAAFGTIGERIRECYGSENKPLFPQQHDEMAIIGIGGDGKVYVKEGNSRSLYGQAVRQSGHQE